ncbi:hypothetical protein EX30DRAFT_348929 [Ascodesmis nigricans]|uniref:Uncharacterized protein n=1 Tax=Ascodesmis nigricans TaxID=341454 RepID=A0A4S2MWK3_9PEZI|nr:hypothetical protein EX30DRAFT_348929 [Ascodesmis nigricans]
MLDATATRVFSEAETRGFAGNTSTTTTQLDREIGRIVVPKVTVMEVLDTSDGSSSASSSRPSTASSGASSTITTSTSTSPPTSIKTLTNINTTTTNLDNSDSTPPTPTPYLKVPPPTPTTPLLFPKQDSTALQHHTQLLTLLPPPNRAHWLRRFINLHGPVTTLSPHNGRRVLARPMRPPPPPPHPHPPTKLSTRRSNSFTSTHTPTPFSSPSSSSSASPYSASSAPKLPLFPLLLRLTSRPPTAHQIRALESHLAWGRRHLALATVSSTRHPELRRELERFVEVVEACLVEVEEGVVFEEGRWGVGRGEERGVREVAREVERWRGGLVGRLGRVGIVG